MFASKHMMIFKNNIGAQLGFFFSEKLRNILLHQCFSERCTCTVFWPSEIPWCVAKCLTEGWWWYSETSEIAILLLSKQAQRHIRSLLFCSKKILYFVSTNTKLAIVSRLLMPCWQIICIAFYVVHLHLTFLSDLRCFLQICVFLHYLTLLYDSDQLI